MAKKKCHGCGIIDSLHNKDIEHSKLVSDFCGKDSSGLIRLLIYCNDCGTVNEYKPGWFGNFKYSRHFNIPVIYRKNFESYGEEKALEMMRNSEWITTKLLFYMVANEHLPASILPKPQNIDIYKQN